MVLNGPPIGDRRQVLSLATIAGLVERRFSSAALASAIERPPAIATIVMQSTVDATALLRREFITDEELNARIRHEGVEDPATVKRVYLEAESEMSAI